MAERDNGSEPRGQCYIDEERKGFRARGDHEKVSHSM